jgi:hypothetical protein
MRPLILSFGGCAVLFGAAWAQNSTAGSAPQLPVGQIYRNFQFPVYEAGQLKWTMSADEARGITLNRAEATNLKIDVYEDGKVTTVITSPKADLYVADRKMRTKNTVLIQRADMDASSQSCDFDMTTKKYLMRDNVKVTLKNFSSAVKPPPGTVRPTAAPIVAAVPVARRAPEPMQPSLALPLPSAERPAPGILDTPGAYGDTNAPSNTNGMPR